MGERDESLGDAWSREPQDGTPRIEEIRGIVNSVVIRLVWAEQDRKEAFDALVACVIDGLSTGACPDPASVSPFRTWIEWRCRDWLRRERVRKFRPLGEAPEAKLVAADTSTTLRGRDLSDLRLWVDELPNERWKEVVRLRYFEGLNSKQIGEQLGLPDGTVRADLKRARDWIRHRHGTEGRRLVQGEDLE
jgi:RNA polymerase sigma factor (sigma-70 family)